MIVVGLAGGIASGKSQVARLFARRGAAAIDADQIGHEVLKMPQIRDDIRREFGSVALGPDGEVDRRSLGNLVFKDDAVSLCRLERLESLTHPVIGHLVGEALERHRMAGCPLVILDAPVMFRSGWHRWCDWIVFIDALPEIRARRAETRGWPAGELARREARQTPLTERRRLATHWIDNSSEGDFHWLDSQVGSLWSVWSRGGFPACHGS